MRPTELLTSVVLFSAAACAWAPGWAPVGGLVQHEAAPMERRQTFDLSFSGVQGNTATTRSETAEETATNSGDAEETATNSGDAEATSSADETGDSSARTTSGTARRTGTATNKATSSGKSKTFDAQSPAGGVSMITPNALSTQYYKIEDYITFAWNYTSLLATPSAVDVLASCKVNSQLYTIAANVSYHQPQTLLWDTGAFQSSATVPLLTETYTLIIHDAAKEISAAPQAGYLAVANSFTFGMYTPKPYTPLDEFRCVTCNGATSLAERQTLLALVGMASLFAVSFGWFTSMAGLW